MESTNYDNLVIVILMMNNEDEWYPKMDEMFKFPNDDKHLQFILKF